MNQVRMQHYVPRSYLRKFANKRERIHVFDKKELRSFFTNIQNIAQERDFYDLPPDVAADTGLDPKLFEKGFARLVDDRLIGELCRYLDFHPYSPAVVDVRVHVAQYIVFQFFRTRTALNQSLEFHQGYTEAMLDQLVAMNWGKEKVHLRPNVIFDERRIALDMNMRSFDNDRMYPFVHAIFARKWVIARTTRAHPLYTSDSPVVLKVVGPACEGVSLLTPDTRIVLPVTPHAALIVLEQNLMPGTVSHHRDCCGEQSLSKNQVAALNRIQVAQSGQWVFSADGDFESARKVCEDEPAFRDPKPRRVAFRHGKGRVHEDGTIRTTIEAVPGTPDHPVAQEPLPDDFLDDIPPPPRRTGS